MMPKSVCDTCIRECQWRAPSGGIDPPVITCPRIIKRPQTNADRVRAMSDEELARFFCDEYGCPIGRGYPDCGETPTDPVCTGCWLDWLKQEAKA